MTEWYLINPHPTLNSGFEKDEFADYAQDGFDELLTETQLGKDIILCKGLFDGENFETEVCTQGVVQSETPDNYTQGKKRQLLTRISELSDFKYIKYDGFIWLIMTEPTDNCIYDKCVIYQCDYVLKWQTQNKKIVYYPAYIENASQYNTGENGDKTITLGYNQLMAYISMDNISVTIDRNLRLFIDYNTVNPSVYKVTRPDTVTYSYGRNRVMCTVVTEDQYNSKSDSIENWLCDYFPTETDAFTIIYSGTPTIRVNGIKALKVDTEETIIWEIDSNINAVIIEDGNSVKIKCPNGNYIGQKIIVTAKIGDVSNQCVLTVIGGV